MGPGFEDVRRLIARQEVIVLVHGVAETVDERRQFARHRGPGVLSNDQADVQIRKLIRSAAADRPLHLERPEPRISACLRDEPAQHGGMACQRGL